MGTWAQVVPRRRKHLAGRKKPEIGPWAAVLHRRAQKARPALAVALTHSNVVKIMKVPPPSFQGASSSPHLNIPARWADGARRGPR